MRIMSSFEHLLFIIQERCVVDTKVLVYFFLGSSQIRIVFYNYGWIRMLATSGVLESARS